jgi:hypothetical protein
MKGNMSTDSGEKIRHWGRDGGGGDGSLERKNKQTPRSCLDITGRRGRRSGHVESMDNIGE